MGWTFSFRGYRKWDSDDDETVEIKTYQEWLKVLTAGGEIFDEYGKQITVDDFKAMVAAKRDAPNHAGRNEVGRNDYWIDDEGHSFADGDFS